jgi:hypothetical protein
LYSLFVFLKCRGCRSNKYVRKDISNDSKSIIKEDYWTFFKSDSSRVVDPKEIELMPGQCVVDALINLILNLTIANFLK